MQQLQGMVQLSEQVRLGSFEKGSVAVEPPKRDRTLAFEAEVRNANRTVLGAYMEKQVVALDGKTERPTFEPRVSAIGKSGPCQPRPTHLCGPHTGSNNQVPSDGRDQELAAPSPPCSPVKNVEDRTQQRKRNCRRVSEGHKQCKKRRKGSQAELAEENVEKALERVIRAGEAVVVGLLLDPSNLTPSQDRSTSLEGALRLGNARHLCGLDDYDLCTPTMDSEETFTEDLEPHSMQRVYEDVGMVAWSAADEKQTDVRDRSAPAEAAPAGTCRFEKSLLSNSDGLNGLLHENITTILTQSSQSLVVADSLNPEIGSVSAKGAGRNQDTEILHDSEADAREELAPQFVAIIGDECHESSEPPVDLHVKNHQQHRSGSPEANDAMKRNRLCNSVGNSDNYSEEVVLPVKVQIPECSPGQGTDSSGGLAQLGSSEDGVQQKAKPEKEVGKFARFRDCSPPLVLRSQATASDGKMGSPIVGKTSMTIKALSLTVSNSTSSPNVSRWFGGWSGTADLKSAADCGAGNVDGPVADNACAPGSFSVNLDQVPEKIGDNGIHTDQVISSEVAEATRSSQNVKFRSGRNETELCYRNDANIECSTWAHDASAGVPVCSFVPSSIPPLTALPSPPMKEGDGRLAVVEVFARTAVDCIDKRRQMDRSLAEAATQVNTGAETGVENFGQQSPCAVGTAVKRRPAAMAEFSTPANSLSLLLQAVDIAGKSISKNRASEGLSPASPENFPACPGTDTATADAKKGASKRNGDSDPPWLSADFLDSPPLLWPRRTKRRLMARRVPDSDSMERLPTFDVGIPVPDTNCRAQEEDPGRNAALHTQRNASLGPHSRRSTRSNPRGSPKAILFRGLQFLVTGFGGPTRGKIRKSIEQYGGTLLADVPTFSTKQRLKRHGVDCGAKVSPIVIAPQQVRTPKFLYGCAVRSPLLRPGWIGASISAAKCLPYLQYRHKERNVGREGDLESGDGPIFTEFQFLFHGQQEFVSELSTLAKHAGGKVIRKLEPFNGAKRKQQAQQQRQQVGLVVVERSNAIPLDLQRAISKLELHVVEAEWMIIGLLRGKALPLPTKSTPPNQVDDAQQPAPRKAKIGKAQTYIRRRRTRALEDCKADADPGVSLFAQRLRRCSLAGATPRERPEDVETDINGRADVWLGKGFASPPPVPPIADGIAGPFSLSLSSPSKRPKRFSYYEGFICNGAEYVLGDNVEVRTSAADCGEPSVARIEGLWCKDERRPQTRAFPQGVRKKAPASLVLICRRYYRPFETGFPGGQHQRPNHELYLSNAPLSNFSASDVLRKVRVTVQRADDFVRCSTSCEGNKMGSNSRYDAAATAYACTFFYDHESESLHRVKFD